MEISFEVEYNGTKYQVEKLGMGALVRFEQHFGVPSSTLADKQNARVEYLVFLAYSHLSARKVLPEGTTYDAFIDGLGEIEVEDATVEEAVDPSVPGPQPG